MNKSRGFTIIELIVVIAIIAVLASIVLVNVTSYINKGKDSAIKGNMASMMTTAAGIYDSNGTYVTVLEADPTFEAGRAAIDDANAGSASDVTIEALQGAYCVQSALLAGGDWCVDSTGYKGTAAGCDATHATCAVEL